VTKLAVWARDVTERKQFEQKLEQRVQARTAALAASESCYRTLFDSNNDGLFVIDMQGCYIDANPAACQMLGYSREELLAMDVVQVGVRGQGLSSEQSPQLVEQLRETWRKVMVGYETELISKTGELIPVDMTITPLTYRGQEAVLGAVRDRGERRRREQELQRAQEETLRRHRFLLALCQAAQAMQRARTSEEVYRTIGDEVEKLGYHAIILALAEDREHLTISHLTYGPKLRKAAEKLTGISPLGFRFPLASDGFFQPIITEGRSAFCENTADLVARGVPGLARPLIDRLMRMMGMERTVYAPLVIDGATHSVLTLAGSDLSEADVPAVTAFANQTAISLGNTRVLEELTGSREQLRRLAQRIVSSQEEERRRLGLALHDEAGQALTALKVSLELLRDRIPAESITLREQVADAVSLAAQTLQQLRWLAQNLRPPALDAVGLNQALEGVCRDFSKLTAIPIDYSDSAPPPLSEEANISLYRFLQEGLTNAARHARANRLSVALLCDAEEVSLLVEDDGRGFDEQAVSSDTGSRMGIGLLGIRERLETLGGRLDIESRPGQGTRLVGRIPLHRARLKKGAADD